MYNAPTCTEIENKATRLLFSCVHLSYPSRVQMVSIWARVRESGTVVYLCLSVRVSACCSPRRPLLGVCHYPAGAALMEAVISNAVN